MRIQLDITEELADALIRESILDGRKREEPRKRWTDSERRQWVREAIMERLPA